MIHTDAWLSEQLGRPAFTVAAATATPAAIADTFASRTSPPDAFYTAKVDGLALPLVAALIAARFTVVETTLTFGRAIERHSTVPDVAVYESPWRDAVLDIAARAFRFSRFHADSRIGSTAANRVKREWVANYTTGRRGDALLVARNGGAITGFNAMLVSERPTGPVAVIDLLAVHPDHQQRGVGRLLVDAALHHYQHRCAQMEVSTQASNIPSVRLYEHMGFRLLRSGFVLHRHGNG